MSDFSIRQAQSTGSMSRPWEIHRPAAKGHPPQNISEGERVGSTLAGSVLLLTGLGHGKLSGLMMSLLGGCLVYRGVTAHCHAYDALGIDTAEHTPATAVPAQQGVTIANSIVVHRSAEDLFSFWREVENLPQVMRHIQRVDAIDSKRSQWVAEGLFGRTVEWEAEILNERENDLIAWRSLPGGDVQTAGSVHFKPLGHDRGTVVAVVLKYNAPAGKIGAAISSLLGSGLEQKLEHDLCEFKSFMEAGEVPTTEGQQERP